MVSYKKADILSPTIRQDSHKTAAFRVWCGMITTIWRFGVEELSYHL